jgi:integrase
MPRGSKKNGLPPRMHRKHGRYYHVSTSLPRKWTPLERDLGSSLKKWAELEAASIPSDQTTFIAISAMYRAQELPKLRDRTQTDYQRHLSFLEPVFGAMDMRFIRPADIHKYVQLRGQASPVQANREKAVMSSIFNFARRLGLIDCPNPCAGIRGHTEKARTRYVTDAEYLAVHALVPGYIQDVLDLALVIGQRPADVLKIDLADISSEHLHISQNKTDKATSFL